MRISRLRRSAALALGLGLLVAGAVAPAALALPQQPDDLADLSVSMSPSGPILSEPNSPLTYSFTIKNPSIKVWDAELHKYYTGGAPASGVVFRHWLPDGSVFLSVSADSGFNCSYAYELVTCSGGSLPNGGIAHVTINTKTPPLQAQYWTVAQVDPNNTIAERSENNNMVSTTLSQVYLN